MKTQTKIAIPILFASIVLVISLLLPSPAHAQPFPQSDDPVSDCEDGVDLYLDDKITLALPLLESGYNNRTSAKFPSHEDLGYCALSLGFAYRSMARYADAQEPLFVALDEFRKAKNQPIEGVVLSNIALTYDSQGLYAEAMQFHTQALALWQKLGYQDWEATVLSNIGFAYYSQGEYANAVEYFQDALTLWWELDDEVGAAGTLNNLGLVYDATGEYEKALDNYNTTLELAEKNNDLDLIGRVLINIGSVYHSQGQNTKALDYFNRALIIVHQEGDKDLEGTALSNIGAVYEAQGQLVKALEYYSQALVIKEAAGNRPGQATSLNNIGAVYFSLGEYSLALSYLERALVIRRAVGDQAGEAVTLNNIGGIYAGQGQLDKALSHYEQSLSIRRKLGDAQGEATTLNNLGSIHFEQGEYSQALDYFNQALTITQEAHATQLEAVVLNSIGGVYKTLGQLTLAMDYYQRALSIAKETGDSTTEGVTLNNMGVVLRLEGEYSKALEYHEQALAIHRANEMREGEGTVLNNMGLVYEAQGRYDQALVYYQQSIAVLETIRSGIDNELSKIEFISQYTTSYNHTINLLILTGQAEQAFQFSERGRSRAFLDSMSSGKISLNDGELARVFNQEQEAYAILAATRTTLYKALAENPQNTSQIDELKTQVELAEKAYQAALEAVTSRDTQLAQLVPGQGGILDVPQAQALLDNETTLLSFWVLEDQTLVFVLTDETFEQISIPIAQTELYVQISALLNFENTNDPHPASALRLYDYLIKPLAGSIKTSNLVIIPHGNLHYLPFAALSDGSEYLIDKFSVSYLPSVSVWPYIKRNEQNTSGTPLILGNPSTMLAPLPFAEGEAQIVGAILGTSPVLGVDATERLIHARAAGTNVLHLAAHGNYNSINPLFSAIELTPDEKEDGRLEVHEIYGLDLSQTHLVVLSACQSQLGKLSNGDEVVGLTRAFFFAGAPSVIGSLWEVDDKATQVLMEKFYRYWSSGMNQSEALQLAQIEMRVEYPNPYYWAAFVLSGQGESIHTEIVEPAPLPQRRALPFCNGDLALLGLAAVIVKLKLRKTRNRVAIP